MHFGKSNIDKQLSFTAYGVKVGIRSNRKSYLDEIRQRLISFLPNGFEFIFNDKAEYLLEIVENRDGKFQIFKNGEYVGQGASEETFLQLVESQIRLTVAEYAVGKVFLHAGVIACKGKAVIIPASSFAGKTTLVAELIKQGAVYYSDEYAVLDKKGLVYPYPKFLSLRGIIDDYRQIDYSAEFLGAETGCQPINVGMVLICKYLKNTKNKAKFIPEILSPGQGMMEMLAHTIPIRFNPEFSLKVLNKVVSRAIIAKSNRGEAAEFAHLFLEYLDSKF